MRISDWSSDVCSSDLINAWEDLQGLKIRMAGLGGEILRRAGSVIVLTPPGEILPAMQSGAIDAAEWIGPWNDIAFGLQKVAKHYYVPDFLEPGSGLEISGKKEKIEAPRSEERTTAPTEHI